jgi:hypothetical protein
MTEEEAVQKLIQCCDAEIRRSGWWIFNDKDLKFTKTRLLQPHEREANLALPPSLHLKNTLINHEGVTIDLTLYKWIDIAATGIKTDAVPIYGFPKMRYDDYLLCCLHNGTIIECPLGDVGHLHGQLGHFIEQYKLGEMA